MEAMIRAGMSVARLNFSHGSFEEKAVLVRRLRAAAAAVGRRVAILADLPGPKLRIGALAEEPVELRAGDPFRLTPEPVLGTRDCVSVEFPALPRVVQPGQRLYLNDGLVQIEVERVEPTMIHGRVRVGGELRSHKGLNLPGVDLGLCAFTERDRLCLQQAWQLGIEIVSQSFVQRAADVHAVRETAMAWGYQPMVIAKMERGLALQHLDEILAAADGLMIARGDLGVEVPIERMALVQKQLIHAARRAAKPVITATQMLESMVASRIPTRAEATDVANAILDGTDAVMLSAESAIGRFPVEAVSMLARIASTVEPELDRLGAGQAECLRPEGRGIDLRDVIARVVVEAFACTEATAVLVPTLSGATARSVARFRLPAWVIAVTPHETTCQRLLLSYGVWPEHEPQRPADWKAYALTWARRHGWNGTRMLLTEGPSPENPRANHRMEILELDPGGPTSS